MGFPYSAQELKACKLSEIRLLFLAIAFAMLGSLFVGGAFVAMAAAQSCTMGSPQLKLPSCMVGSIRLSAYYSDGFAG